MEGLRIHWSCQPSSCHLMIGEGSLPISDSNVTSWGEPSQPPQQNTEPEELSKCDLGIVMHLGEITKDLTCGVMQ